MNHHHENVRITELDLFGFTANHLGRVSDENCRWMTKQLTKAPRNVCIHTKIKTKKALKVLNALLNHRHDFKRTLEKMFDMLNADNDVDRSIALIGWMIASAIDHKKWMETIEKQKDSITDDEYVKNCRHAKIVYLFNQLPAVECVFNHLEIVPENN
jgi:hypothetical protein